MTNNLHPGAVGRPFPQMCSLCEFYANWRLTNAFHIASNKLYILMKVYNYRTPYTHFI